jgi:DNA invertase Pin-like site-specific DNA recombinase
MEETMRAVGYRRVSMREQVDGFSLDAQENNIRKYATERNWQVVQVYTDAGISAKKDSRRPQLLQLMSDAQAGKFDIVIVDKIDRFYRHLSGLLNALDQLNEKGVSFVSVQERLDFTTPWGKLSLTMLGMLAEIYIDNLRQETRKGKLQRARSGLWNGNAPFGYCKGLCAHCQDANGPGYCPDFGKPDKGDGKSLFLHPVDQHAVRLAYELYLTGEMSHVKVAEMVNQRGVTLTDGTYQNFRQRSTAGQKDPGPLTKDFVRGLLMNVFYTGKVPYYCNHKRQPQSLFHGLHPVLISETDFQKVQELRLALASNCRSKNGHSARLYPLSGLLHCASCGWTWRGVSSEYSMYYRDASQIERQGICDQPMLKARVIEEKVRSYLLEIVNAWITQAKPEQVLGNIAQVEDQLSRLQTLYLQGEIEREHYENRKMQIESILKDLSKIEYRAMLAQSQEIQRKLETWPRILPTEQKRLLRIAAEAIFVHNNALVAIQPTFAFLPMFSSPLGEICSSGPDGIRTRGLGLDRAAC